MWQLETDATKASSGSTFAGFEYGTGTTDGEGDAGTVAPPSNVQVCSREYLPFRKSELVRFQLMVALCSNIGRRDYSFTTLTEPAVASYSIFMLCGASGILGMYFFSTSSFRSLGKRPSCTLKS